MFIGGCFQWSFWRTPFIPLIGFSCFPPHLSYLHDPRPRVCLHVNSFPPLPSRSIYLNCLHTCLSSYIRKRSARHQRTSVVNRCASEGMGEYVTKPGGGWVFGVDGRGVAEKFRQSETIDKASELAKRKESTSKPTFQFSSSPPLCFGW